MYTPSPTLQVGYGELDATQGTEVAQETPRKLLEIQMLGLNLHTLDLALTLVMQSGTANAMPPHSLSNPVV